MPKSRTSQGVPFEWKVVPRRAGWVAGQTYEYQNRLYRYVRFDDAVVYAAGEVLFEPNYLLDALWKNRRPVPRYEYLFTGGQKA